MSSNNPNSKSEQQELSSGQGTPKTAAPPLGSSEPAAEVRLQPSPTSGSTDTMISTAPPIEPEREDQPVRLPTASTDVEVDLSYRAPPSIAWRSLPIRDEGSEGLLMPLLAACLGWLTYLATGNALTTSVAVVALLGIFSQRILPTKWEVGREGVTSTRLGFATKHPWRSFAAYQLDRRGVLLLLDRNPLPWQYLRAVHVPWGPDQDQLLALVTHYMGPPMTEVDE